MLDAGFYYNCAKMTNTKTLTTKDSQWKKLHSFKEYELHSAR